MNDLKVTQNFIKSSELIKKLIHIIGIKEDDVVLDIGAGEGIISEKLIEVCKKVIAVELDNTLYKNLLIRFNTYKNIEILNLDFMKYQLPSTPYKVFSNIPFNQTTSIVEKLLFSVNTPLEAYLIIQKESAKRFLGDGEGYLLHQLITPFYSLGIVHEFKTTDFNPSPNVDCVLFSIKKIVNPKVSYENKELYYDFISYLFNQQKPSIKLRINKLFTFEQLKRIKINLGIDIYKPLSEISEENIINLFNIFMKYVPEEKQIIVTKAFNNYRYLVKKEIKTHKTRAHKIISINQ